jgi:hypothetical protein
VDAKFNPNSARWNQRNSPLLRLPAELRNLIFRFALGGNTWSFVVREPYGQRIHNCSGFQHTFALLAVCRQIYVETALLPFSLRSFSFNDPEDFDLWLKALHPAQRDGVSVVGVKHWLHVLKFPTLPYPQAVNYILYNQSWWSPGNCDFSGLPSLQHIRVRVMDESRTASASRKPYMNDLERKRSEIKEEWEVLNLGFGVTLEEETSSSLRRAR